MRITPAQASKLLNLQRGASLTRSEINKVLREDLINRGAIRLKKSGAGYRVVANPEKLESVLANHYSIRDLNSFVSLLDGSERSRAEVTQATGNSKALPVAPMRGLYLSIIGDAGIYIEGVSATPQPGTALFVPANRISDLSINPLRILGIENVEAFLNAERLCLKLPSAAVTVLRWNWGGKWREWVDGHCPEFLYAGDYDWGGVSIFENEVLPVSPKANFLVPSNFLERLSKGDRKLYSKQEEKYRNYVPRSDQGQFIYTAVGNARKALEQEALIR